MLAPRDPSDPQRNTSVRDASLYGLLIGLVAFVLLLILMEGWVIPLLLGLVAGVVAALFFLWSMTDGFSHFADDAAGRIESRLPRGRRGAAEGAKGAATGSGDRGGIEPAMPDPDAVSQAPDAEASARAFESAGDISGRQGLAGNLDRGGHSGDPHGADPAMPDPDSTSDVTAEDAAVAFEGGTEDARSSPIDMAAREPSTFEGDAKGSEEFSPGTAEAEGVGADGEGAGTVGDAVSAPRLLSEPEGGRGDDLKQIRGVGPKLEAMLQDLGVWHFHQIASWGPDEVAWVDGRLEGFNGRIERDEWVLQARALRDGEMPVAGDRDGL